MYKIVYRKQVVKFLQKQKLDISKRIIKFFETIKQDPYDFKGYDVKPLKGYENYYRLRIGKYRVIFLIEDEELIIEAIRAGSRGDIYKQQ